MRQASFLPRSCRAEQRLPAAPDPEYPPWWCEQQRYCHQILRGRRGKLHFPSIGDASLRANSACDRPIFSRRRLIVSAIMLSLPRNNFTIRLMISNYPNMYGFVDKRQKDLYTDRVRMQREGYRDGKLEFPNVKDTTPKTHA